ncbi:acetoacetate decarboxylase family protein [Nocardioides sp. AE5]|uniref:acetoacetate decarboxylase family protein n=1 Tax=Nocardioides sp. AE5 TaxID=2962573 RepID=UPI0028820291|nr:acetoacetate decarboxylase family protein [Nocardioides sp. AE5]MDT0201488.1 acetoacetate decarboxylase family protein [Nocardioides sp. AE5]
MDPDLSGLDLRRVPGVPETAIDDALVATLPANEAPAPWAVRSTGMVWMHRANPAADDALPEALRRQGATSSFVIGGFVRYTETPVGAYDEVFGVVGYRIGRQVGATVAFMAVDSATSLVGGRENWSMPKAMASFTGEPAPRREMTAAGTNEHGWSVRATAGRAAPPVPVFSRARVVQEFADGSVRGCRLRARGWSRLTRVEVEVSSSASLPAWLRSGRHPGATLSGINFSLGVPLPQ